MKKFITLIGFITVSLFAQAQTQTSTADVVTTVPSNRADWTNASSTALEQNDDVFSTVTLTGNAANTRISDYLILSDFDFTIPEGQIILSITVNITGSSNNSSIAPQEVSIGTVSGGTFTPYTFTTNSKSGIPLPALEATQTIPFTSAEFGTLTTADINSQNFAIRLNLRNAVTTTGTASIDQISVTVVYIEAIPTPVTFISFNAKKEGAFTKLTWNIAEQDNVSHYDVERGSNGVNFTKIGEVEAKDVTTYSFTDMQPVEGTAFYRIKNVDNDGKYFYSTVVSLRNGTSTIVLKAFPLPARNSVTVHHNTATAQSKIRISSQDGRLVQSLRPAVGTMQTNINLSTYTPGLYMLSYDSGNGTIETIKLVKQ